MTKNDLLTAVYEANGLTPPPPVSFDSLPAGHPVDLLLQENRALEKLLDAAEAAAGNNSAEPATMETLQELLRPLAAISGHYAKKQQLMPMLDKYLEQSPSGPLWDLDVEIREDVKRVIRTLPADDPETARKETDRICKRLRAMIKREEELFYPLCLQNLSEEEWFMLYRDLKKRGRSFVADEPERFLWPEGEAWAKEDDKKRLDRIRACDDLVLPLYGGDVTVKQLRCMLDLLPVCLTYVDEHEINRYFLDKNGPFARSLSAIGGHMLGCHPPKLEPAIRGMIENFHNHTKARVVMWLNNPKDPARVIYQAVYDEDGKYMGVLEMVESYGDVMEKLKGMQA